MPRGETTTHDKRADVQTDDGEDIDLTRPIREQVDLDTDLAKVFRQVYIPMRLRAYAPSTAERYKIELRRLERFLGRPATVGDLSDSVTAALLGDMTERGSSRATRSKTRAQFVALSRFLFGKGILPEVIDVPHIRVPRRMPEAWSLDEMKRLLWAADQDHYLKNGIHAGHWWKSLIMVCFDSGERIGPLLHARWSDFDAEKGTLLLPAETRKGAIEDMLHAIKAETADEIEAMRLPERKLIWAWPQCSNTLYNHLDDILTRAGLPTGSRDKFHRIRRTTATLLEAAGHDATAALGHSSRTVTLKHYIDPRKVPRVRAAHVLPSLVGEPYTEGETRPTDLNDRELVIVASLRAGDTPEDIVKFDCSSIERVEWQLADIRYKIGVDSNDEIIAWAEQAGVQRRPLLPTPEVKLLPAPVNTPPKTALDEPSDEIEVLQWM